MATDLRTKQKLWLLVRFIVLFNSMTENSLYIHNPQENSSINLLMLKFITDQIKKKHLHCMHLFPIIAVNKALL